MGLKENIKIKRLEEGLTLEELAHKIGKTKQTVQKYESGVISNIPSDIIEKLADALQTTPGYLMGWKDNSIKSKIDEMRYTLDLIESSEEHKMIYDIQIELYKLNIDGIKKVKEYINDLSVNSNYLIINEYNRNEN